MESRTKVLAIALGALALLVGGIGVAAAATLPAHSAMGSGHAVVSSLPPAYVLDCKPPQPNCGPG